MFMTITTLIPQQSLSSFKRALFPTLDGRTPLSSTNWPNLLSPVLVNFVLAFLSRKPNTQTLRRLLLPIAVLSCIRSGSHFIITSPGYFVYNMALGLVSLTMFARALDFIFSTPRANDIVYNHNPQTKYNTNPRKTFLTTLSEANKLMSTVRGVGIEYGKAIPLPPETRPLQRRLFLRATFFMFLRSYILFDFLEFAIKLAPPFRTYGSGTLYMETLPVPQRFLFAMIIHVGTGCFIIEITQASYHLATLINVCVFNQSPSLWPPLFDHPWRAESLQEFWGKRWHQLLRRTFLILGGYPCEWIGNKVGLGRVFMLFGTFFASGLFHELPYYLLGSSFDWRPPLFFVSQAFLIYLERSWSTMTGKKVRGWWGRLWVYFSLLILAQILVESWHSRGVGSGIVTHDRLSLSRHLILPILNARFEGKFH